MANPGQLPLPQDRKSSFAERIVAALLIIEGLGGWASHLATAGCWFRGVPERYAAGADRRGRQGGRPYPWSQQVIYEISGLNVLDKELWLGIEHGFKDFTFSAYPHLAFPISLHLSLTYGSTDEPTEMSTVELPSGTFFSCFWGTALEIPTRLSPKSGLLHGQKEQ
jgi:hypothetical protein